MNYLPSKSFFYTVLAVFLCVIGVFLFSKIFNTAKENSSAINEGIIALPGNPQTTKGNMWENSYGATTTLMAKALYYDELAQSGTTTTVKEVNDIVTAEIKQAKDNILADKYKKSDIKISNDNSVEALKKYGNALGDIMKKYGKIKSDMSEIDIIKKGIGEGQIETLSKLNEYISLYKNIIPELLLLSVPSDISSLHLRILNGYASLLAVDQGYLHFSDDISIATGAFYSHPEALKKFIEAYRDMYYFFQGKGITFSKEEGGYVLKIAL